jgi:hypothetical protein
VADIFVSYTSSDREWAFWLTKELEALTHSPHVHEWELKGGDDIYAWMEQRHDAADHVLCVVSDKAPYSTLERNAALWQAASKRPGFVLFVAVKPCRLPTLSDHIRRCELFGIPQDAARLRFREFMSVQSAPAAVALPGKVFAVSNIPIRVPEHFLGRDDALAAIETRSRGLLRIAAAVLRTAPTDWEHNLLPGLGLHAGQSRYPLPFAPAVTDLFEEALACLSDLGRRNGGSYP